MAVNNGQPANKDSFNNAFLSRTTNSSTVGKIGFKNTDSESGPIIENAQKAINEAKSVADTVTTLASQVSAATTEVSRLTGEVAKLSAGTRGFKYTFTYEDLQDFPGIGTDDAGITGLLLPEQMCVDKVIIVPKTQFEGPGFTGAKVNIGAYGGSDPYSYMPLTDVGGAPSETNWKSNNCCDVNNFGETGGNGFDVYFKVEGCDLSDLTAGEFEVYFYMSDISKSVVTGWR